MATRRWTDAGTTWFAISGAGPELTALAEHVLMDYQRDGDEWRRGYPADTPGLDICWQNFAGCAELMLRQAARLEPVPWQETLRELCRRTSGQESGWWLAGSTALADFGPVAASRLETVTWEGWQLRVPPLDLQRAVSERRGLTARVALIDALPNK
jgi:hypothetical protein